MATIKQQSKNKLSHLVHLFLLSKQHWDYRVAQKQPFQTPIKGLDYFSCSII